MPSDGNTADYAERLESRGWTRAVAGADFDLAVRILDALAASHKGLVLSGDYGSGKTSFVKAAFPRFHFFAMPNDEWILSDSQNALDFGKENIVVDDVGCEHKTNLYGVKTENFADFIVRRHAMALPTRLILTTNLTTAEFEARYGGRVVSRLKEMCLAAHFVGKDKRQWEIIR